MNTAATLVYYAVWKRGNGVLVASLKELAAMTGLSPRGIIYAVKELEKSGLILVAKLRINGRIRNGYIAFPLNAPLCGEPTQQQERIRLGLSRLAVQLNGTGLQSPKTPKSDMNIRFLSSSSLAKPGETVIDLSKFFPTRKYMAVSNATMERIMNALAAVVAYARKHTIRNLEAILVAAITRAWRAAAKVVAKVKALLTSRITRSYDKYRELYRLVSEEEAERNKAACRPPDPEPEDKYRELYRLSPVDS